MIFFLGFQLDGVVPQQTRGLTTWLHQRKTLLPSRGNVVGRALLIVM